MPPLNNRLHGRGGSRGFSLVEVLSAIAVLSILMLILVNLCNQAGRIWNQGEQQNQYRQKARIALDIIGNELRQAVLDVDRNASRLQFVINPPSLVSSAYQCKDSIFWQAPLATDTQKSGLAEVGYLVQWTKDSDNLPSKPTLCRYFVNPSDPNYFIYSNPNAWITDSLVQYFSPADSASNYRGLFLENVLGMWIKGYQEDGALYGNDSRGITPSRLPAYVEVTLVFISGVGAERLRQTKQFSAIQSLYHTIADGGSTTASANAFVTALPTNVKDSANVMTLRVSMDNYK